ncbi:MAG TPA: protein-L-isoaspartate(D-aspartate) O-methyltransferase [Silvibacterium sp.]|nr:protein-L-isoaspartate(D-aspartate) O-methyltransferase [Silvibacterium sp.]
MSFIGVTTMDRMDAYRRFFAKLVTANAGVSADSELAAAFASTPREQFVGKAPWRVFTSTGYIDTPSDDPAFLYQDVVVSLGGKGPLNNGQPSLHALCIATLAPQKGETVVHVGAGTGYYTTLLAKLVGEAGKVIAYEIDAELAQRAAGNLCGFSQVTVNDRSGAEGPIPDCDILYVNAGATSPLAVWLDALRPNGRLLFPLTASDGAGAMLLLTRNERGSFAARFLCQVQFVPCVGARDEATAAKLAAAFRRGGWHQVKELHRSNVPGESCWCSGSGWWLSTNSGE